MEHSLFPLRTGFQCVLGSKEQLPQLRRLFGLLRREGLYGVKLSLSDLNLIEPKELKSLSNEHQMKMNMLATGVYARTHGLSLSSGISEERMRAVNGCKRNIDYAASVDCGTIIGSLKGGPNSDHEASERLFLESMLELEPYVEEKKVQVFIEATNHKEAPIVRAPKEEAHAINFLDCPFIQLLADTHHMNIEESSLVDSLSEYMNYYPHLHISDDNRAYPGLGSLDFATICGRLVECGYEGIVAAEGGAQRGLLEGTQICTTYLHKMCSGLHTPSRVPSHAIQ